jgi:hypothetical protein
MRRELILKLALGCAGVFMGGSVAGMSLANYVASGSFDFYRQPRVAQWTPDPRPASIQSTDLALASDRRELLGSAAPDPALAAFDR